MAKKKNARHEGTSSSLSVFVFCWRKMRLSHKNDACHIAQLLKVGSVLSAILKLHDSVDDIIYFLNFQAWNKVMLKVPFVRIHHQAFLQHCCWSVMMQIFLERSFGRCEVRRHLEPEWIPWKITCPLKIDSWSRCIPYWNGPLFRGRSLNFRSVDPQQII